MRTRFFRMGLASIGLSAAVASAQGPTYPPLPPLKPVVPPAPSKPVTPVGGATSALPTPPMVTVPEVLPALGTQPPETKPTTPTIPVVPATPPAVPPSAPVQPAAGTTKPDVKIHMTFGAPATDAGARYAAALADAKAAYAKVRDYSCHLKKVERINGKLQPEQTAELHARSKPASVYMKFIGPRDLVGMEACFVSGKFAGNAKFRVKPAGVLGIGGFQTMAINDSRVMATNRHTIDQVGIGALIDLLEKNAQIERQLNNSVAFSVAEYSFVNRPVTRYEMICNQPHAHRYCYKAVVYVDKETKLPVRFEAYDVPSAGAPEGELLECYSYVNLKLNPGHGAAVFDR